MTRKSSASSASPPSAGLPATSSTVQCDYASIPTAVPSLISVLPRNHSLLLDGEQHPCNEPVLVSGDGSATLTCAVDSKPEATTFKWSSASDIVGSKTGATTCVQHADKIYRCTNTLSLPKADIPLVAVKVTCQVDAVGNRTDLCITIRGEFGAMQALRNAFFLEIRHPPTPS